MPRNRTIGKRGKIVQMFPDFSDGLNTAVAVHQIQDSELAEGTNFDIDEQGSVSKRKGWTTLITSLGTGKVQGMYVYRKFFNKELLLVHNGLLYRFLASDPMLIESGTWERVYIRRHAPTGLSNVLATTGTPGAHIVASTVYDYQVVAKDASGTTTLSGVSRVTQGTTTRAATISWDKVLGCTGYDIYRNGKRITSVGDVSFWVDDGTYPPGTENPPTTNSTSLTIPSTSEVEFVNYNDRTFFTTGAGICMYDGVVASLVTPYVPTTTEEANIGSNSLRSVASSIHKCRYIKIHWDRIVVSGDPDYPQNFYWTDLNLSMTHPHVYFPGVYGSDVTSANGSPITGMANYRDGLILFTTDSIHAMFGKQPDETKPEPFVLRLIHPEVGCASSRSIAIVNNAVLFVSRFGVYALTNVVASTTAMNVQYLSQKIEPTFRNMSRPDLTCAVFHGQQYKVCFPEDGVVLRWYVNRQAWALDTNCKFSALVPWDTDLLAASYTNGIVKKFGVRRIEDPLNVGAYIEVPTYSDDTNAIPFYVRTKSFDMNATINLKKFRRLYLLARQYEVPSSVNLTAYVDYEKLENSLVFDTNESTVVGTWELGDSYLGWVDVVLQEIRFRGKGSQVYFTFKNEVLDEPVTVYGLGIQFKIKPV